MNLNFQHLLPADFAPASRVWIYQSNCLFSLSEALEIETIIDDFIEKWNSQDLDGYLQLYHPDMDAKGFPDVQPGLDSLKEFYQAFWSAVPCFTNNN